MRHSRRISSAARAYRLRYPDGPHNAEVLLVHPRTGDLYIVTAAGGKDRDTRVCVARARELKKQSVTLTALATLGVPASDFDAIWEQQFRPATVGLGLEVEGVCLRADGKAQ
jgi:hypothetical protein